MRIKGIWENGRQGFHPVIANLEQKLVIKPRWQIQVEFCPSLHATAPGPTVWMDAIFRCLR
jgi:hypothetical protein